MGVIQSSLPVLSGERLFSKAHDFSAGLKRFRHYVVVPEAIGEKSVLGNVSLCMP